MSWPEIGLRFYRKIRGKVWKCIGPLIFRNPCLFSKDHEGSPGDWIEGLQKNFPIKAGENLLDRYTRYFSLEKVWAGGEDLIQGKIPIFESIYDTGGKIPDWHRDFLNPQAWPKVFFTQINHNDLRYGNVIHVWELNRHFYFYDLAKAYRLTGDRRFAQTLLTHLESWIDQNPTGMGINWHSPMENGLRMISWLWGLFLVSVGEDRFPDLPPLIPRETRKKILTSVFWQTYFIEKNLSKYSSANNHRIGEALGLFWVGSLFPSLSRAEKWKQKGWAILCEEIEIQVFPDGVPREQSSRYLFFLFDLYTLAILLARKENRVIPQVLWDRLEMICEYVMAQMDSGGHLPDLGDSSDGQACKLHTTSLNPYRSLLITGAMWFKRADFKTWGGKIDERNFWLFSQEEVQGYEELGEDASEKGSRIFPHGGQIILRKGREAEEAVLVFDAGPFGFLSLAAHAHADALSFTLSMGGVPVLIDPGTFLYHDGGKWRYYFRGTSAHNTIEVDGKDQALSGGPFMWLTQPKTTIEKAVIQSDDDVIVASHTGYEHLSDPVRHERSIAFNKKEGFWTIKDRLETKGVHSILQTFHFHPACQVKKAGNTLFQISADGPILYINLDPRITSSLHRGEEDPIRGWFSPAFGKKEPTITLAGRTQIEGTTSFKTTIWKEKIA